MVSSARQARYAYEDYVALEAASNTKHEFLDGVIYAMAGGSPDHASLTATVARYLGNQVVGSPCRVHSSEQRIRVHETGLSTYPDVSVICGRRALDPEDRHAITNPRVLVEVLSPATAAYDRGDKFDHYKHLTSLEAYILVAQDTRKIEVFRRDGDRWLLTEAGPGQTAAVDPISAVLDVNAIYDEAAEPEEPG